MPLLLILILASWAICLLSSYIFLVLFDSAAYNTKQYFAGFSVGTLRYYPLLLLTAVLYISGAISYMLSNGHMGIVIGSALTAGALYSGVMFFVKSKKTISGKLQNKKRAARLYIAVVALTTLFCAAGYFAGAAILALFIIVLPLAIPVANLLLLPIEQIIRRIELGLN
jgi:hypothetical protein